MSAAAHDAEQVETLADVLREVEEAHAFPAGLEAFARAVLASPWLADLITRERADAAREALLDARDAWVGGEATPVLRNHRPRRPNTAGTGGEVAPRARRHLHREHRWILT